MTTESAQYLATLHKQIDTYFSFSEVRTLCFNLGVDYENIPGDRRSAFIRNLVVSLAKQGRLQELVDNVREERSRVDWQDVPPDFELPTSVAQENIQQVVNYTVYGDVVHGDKVGGDKVAGDKISVGNISGGEGIAIGSGASASVQETMVQPTPVQQSPAVPTSTNVNVQQTAVKLNRYLKMASAANQNVADELATSINIVLAVAEQQPVDAVHLKLLCLGQVQLAQKLSADIPEIDQVVAGFVTAVTKPDH
ncbi:hypothetical protein MNBD_CHLOROFLEXI01-2454 [hydrothermal vent metagenome]|uniref:Effector-associated domain-containing protein n=1 Tax=hydrothermal vent metagenome TaxID=652676 RepID=A0A3B0UWU3_9ZZZZ